MEFQSSQQKLQRSPLWHYSYESQSIHIAPWRFSNFTTKPLADGEEQSRVWPAFTDASAHRRRGLGWGKRRRGRDEPKGGLLGARGSRIWDSPRRGAAASWVARRRPFCGGGLGSGRCLGDAQYSCGANGGVCGGG